MKFEIRIQWCSDRLIYRDNGCGFYHEFIEKVLVVEKINDLKKAVINGINKDFDDGISVEINDTDPGLIDAIRFSPYNYDMGYSRCENSYFLLDPENIDWTEIEEYFRWISTSKNKLAKYTREALKEREQLMTITRG